MEEGLSKIQPREVVMTLMKQCASESGQVPIGKGSVQMKDAIFLVFQCPKCTKLCKFLQNSGYSNPFSHLKQCLGAEKILHQQYNKAKEEQAKGGSLSEFFDLKPLVTPKEKAVYGWLKFLIKKSLPVAYVEDPEVREFSKFGDIPISRDTMTRTIIQLIELVEEKIAEELKDTPHGGLVHDGWTCNGTHYVGVFATYIIQYKKYHSKKDVEIVEEPVITLLACAP
jgi:hypothetical protein